MKNILRSLFIAMICHMASTVSAADVTFTMSSIFDGSNQSANVTTPTAATVSTNASKSNAKTGKLGSDGHYFEIVLASETYTAASINGFINTNDQSKNWAFQFSTDGGTNWSSEVTQANDGNKTAHDIAVGVTIPANANGFRVVRRAGTSTQVNSITLTLAGPAGPSTDATLSSIVYGAEQTPVPGFAADKLSYEVELPADFVGSAPSVQATANDTKATVSYTQATTLPGTAKIDVTAEDGTTKKQYTVTFSKASAAPKVESATWTNIKGTAVIDQVNKTITGKVTNGSSLTLTPQFTGKNIASWTPNTAQNFSTGSIEYTFTSSSSEITKYMVTITEAPATSTDATLKSLTYGGKSVPNFSPTTYTYNIELAEGIKTPPTIAAETNDAKATKVITQASSVPGSGKVEVTAEDGETKLTYTINYTVEVPSSDLTIHVPEVYEAKDIAGGYNTPLTVVGGREYEVYYTERTKDDDYPTFSTTTVTDGKTNGISGSTTKTKNVGRPGDTWFEGTILSHSECKNASSQDEFTFVSKGIREHRLGSENKYQFHVKGFDQFSLWGMDKKLDPKNGNQVFVVKVDGVEQTTDPSLYNTEAYTIRRYNISTAEHLIEISTTCTGSNVCYMGGFSLRVAQEPRTKYLKGNDSTQRVLQTQAIQPIVYVTKYNSIPGAETMFEWLGAEATGIYLAKPKEGGLTDTLTISGTAQCPVGTYKYAVVAYYKGVETSRAEGKFTVATDLQAMTELNVEVYQNEEMDQIKFRYYALDETAVQLTWPNGQPAGISGRGAANNIYIIGGTPTALEGLYPYEITAVGADTTFKGTIRVKKLDYGANPVLYLYKNTGADAKDYVYTYLASRGWNMISRKAKEDGLRPADQYAKYKWVLISEDADANNEEVLAVVRGGANLPVLNMNAFTYAYERNDEMPRGWGEPDNGSISQGGCYITVQRNDHPIFKALNKKRGDKIQILDTVTFKGMMPINILLQGTLCLATSPTRDIEDYEADGKMQTIIHEIPATMRGGAKYIAFPIAKNSTPNLTDDGKKVLNAVVNYLTNNESTVTVPTVQITSFTLNGIAGDIDQINKTIKVNIDRSKYPDINLKEAQPVVTLASDQTTVSPASGETVDLSTSAILPVKYEVTDFINRCVYNVTVTFYSPEGIDEVYAVGDWVNVYDIFGRKIATTNEDIYTMPLPRGVYVIVTESGQTLKITR